VSDPEAARPAVLARDRVPARSAALARDWVAGRRDDRAIRAASRTRRLACVVLPIAVLFAALGGAWGLAADRIAVRWPEHDPAEVDEHPAGRRPGWRTAVTIVLGAVGLGMVPIRFGEPVHVAVFGAYVLALTLLLATDLDQRLLPNEVTLPAIPIALMVLLAGLNPLVGLDALPVTVVLTIVVPAVMALIAVPFGAGAIGQGDLKLLLSVGLMAGGWRLVAGVVYGCLLAGVVIVALLVARRITLRSFIPFGPFLIIGAFWAILGPG
jgi:leader peptidase (prepilin peptidase)/N-methyltransferase